MARNPDSSQACIGTEDIAVAITDNQRNNFSRVIGLPYFCGDSVKSHSAPHLRRTSAHSWIRDLENRTQINWDDSGRVELAKTYALDSACTHLVHCASKHKNVWDRVKASFLEIYPEERSLPSAGNMYHRRAALGKIALRKHQIIMVSYGENSNWYQSLQYLNFLHQKT